MSETLENLAKGAVLSVKAAWRITEQEWVPFVLSEKQKTFLALPHKEVLYGGAAGGGKSWALLAGALEHVNNPKYSALLLRRSYQDLNKSGALMDVAHQWLQGTGARWNQRDFKWTFPSGATLEFGYIESEKDKYNFQGAQWNFIGFDELTQQPEANYLYLLSRLRRESDSDVPSRVRSTTNPGGLYFEWVNQRFIPEGFTTVVDATQMVYEKEGTNAAGENVIRAFVPAALSDNPGLDKKDYESSLNELDPVTREQLLRGDWVIRAKGDIYPMWDERDHIITWRQFSRVVGSRYIPDSWALGIGLDWGSTKDHPFVVSFLARAPEGTALSGCVFLYRTITGYNLPPRVIAEKIRDAQKRHNEFDRTLIWVMSHEAKSERDTFIMDHGLPFGAWKPDRTGGIAQVRDYLYVRGTESNPFHPDRAGSPSLFLVVNDDEEHFGKTDAGLARHRLEFPLYHYAENGLPFNKELNDAMDSLRGVASVFFPPVLPLTQQELAMRRLNSIRIKGDYIDDYHVALIKMTEAYKREELRKNLEGANSEHHWIDQWWKEKTG